MRPVAMAVAGPGPTSWLHRITLFSTRNPTPASSSRSSSSTYSQKSRRKPSSFKPTPKSQPSPSKKPVTLRRINVIENNVILLRPPPDYPITAQLEELSVAMKEYNLDRVLSIWSHVVDLGAISRLDSITFKYISEFIADILHRRGSPNLNKLAAISPEKYGLLLNMSIESAARDHISGFFFILLRLLEIGRPGDVVNAFNNAKSR